MSRWVWPEAGAAPPGVCSLASTAMYVRAIAVRPVLISLLVLALTASGCSGSSAPTTREELDPLTTATALEAMDQLVAGGSRQLPSDPCPGQNAQGESLFLGTLFLRPQTAAPQLSFTDLGTANLGYGEGDLEMHCVELQYCVVSFWQADLGIWVRGNDLTGASQRQFIENHAVEAMNFLASRSGGVWPRRCTQTRRNSPRTVRYRGGRFWFHTGCRS